MMREGSDVAAIGLGLPGEGPHSGFTMQIEEGSGMTKTNMSDPKVELNALEVEMKKAYAVLEEHMAWQQSHNR